MTAVTSPTVPPVETLSRAGARRVALAAQGFRDPRHTVPTMRTFSRTLARTGVLAPHGETCVFTSDYAFGSASAAAAVVCGRPSNGTLEWKVKGEGTTYKEWEARQLGAEPPLAAIVPAAISS